MPSGEMVWLFRLGVRIMQLNLWQKTTALHDRIDIRLFDEEWDKRRVKHEKKVEDMPTTIERWMAYQMRGLSQEEMTKHHWLARLQAEQQQLQPGLRAGLGSAMAQQWHYFGGMQKCPYCGR